jgi:hypothetical protein
VIRAAAALLLLLAAAACGPPALPPPPPKPSVSLASRVPNREDLVCFPCHSLQKFEKGPPFAHGTQAHLAAGHCHACHQGSGHEPREIDPSACLACHKEGSRALGILAANQEGER